MYSVWVVQRTQPMIFVAYNLKMNMFCRIYIMLDCIYNSWFSKHGVTIQMYKIAYFADGISIFKVTFCVTCEDVIDHCSEVG